MFVIVLCRSRIEFPAVTVAAGDLLVALELLVVLILHADGTADVVDDVLVGGRVVAARCFVADAVGRFPVGVDVAAGQLPDWSRCARRMRSRRPRRPLRAADAVRSRSSVDGGIGTMSSSGIVRRVAVQGRGLSRATVGGGAVRRLAGIAFLATHASSWRAPVAFAASAWHPLSPGDAGAGAALFFPRETVAVAACGSARFGRARSCLLRSGLFGNGLLRRSLPRSSVLRALAGVPPASGRSSSGPLVAALLERPAARVRPRVPAPFRFAITRSFRNVRKRPLNLDSYR